MKQGTGTAADVSFGWVVCVAVSCLQHPLGPAAPAPAAAGSALSSHQARRPRHFHTVTDSKHFDSDPDPDTTFKRKFWVTMINSYSYLNDFNSIL